MYRFENTEFGDLSSFSDYLSFYKYDTLIEIESYGICWLHVLFDSKKINFQRNYSV